MEVVDWIQARVHVKCFIVVGFFESEMLNVKCQCDV